MRKTLCGWLFLALGLTAPVGFTALQEPKDDPTTVTVEDLVVTYFRARHVSPRLLVEFVSETRSTWIQVHDTMQGTTTGADSIKLLGDAILVRGSRAYVDGMVADLARLDEALREPEKAPAAAARPEPLVELEYEPKSLDVMELYTALERYYREVSLPKPDGRGSAATLNVTVLPQRGLLLILETEERAAEMLRFLERLDQPAPQLSIEYLVLEGRAAVDGDDAEAPPEELAASLRRLLPSPHFAVVTRGLLRGSARQAMSVRLDQAREGPSMGLTLQTGALDTGSGTLTLRSCKFELESGSSRRTFETGASLRAGEYTAIASAGREGTVLVLRLSLE